MVCSGTARRGRARLGPAVLGKARTLLELVVVPRMLRYGRAGPGGARFGEAWRGWARRGVARVYFKLNRRL
jgi:hypothetical protein